MRLRDLVRGSGGGGNDPSPDPEGSSDELTRVRQHADDLLSACDEAIDRALCGDSQAFLEANQQRGGQ